MDKLRAIEVFRRVIELGSFRAAAEDLNLSKAAISKNINELEDFLKTALINRTTRKLHITESGQVYYDQIKVILDNLASADLSMIESSNVLRGSVKISIPMTLGVLKINPIICDFMKLHPEISIEVVMSDSYIDLVEQGIDIAIRGGGLLKNSSLKSRKLLDIERVVCAAPEYLKNAPELEVPEDLTLHNCLIYTLSSSKHWTFKKGEETQSVDLNPGSYAVNNGLGLKQAIISGLGVTLTPRMFVDDALANGDVVELLQDWQAETHALYAIYPFHKEQSPKIRTLIDFLVEHLPG
ncbi:LysR family transcriptional regulator [Thalassomonas sp. RHCl1]|uniref:LysR family transcriptional regulator n=1 Tax=Thalassomonas sp. RHCl1 TaxID=2995320 RepID=UPI00248C2391|nr:LysR family transcriptional regulator [Thalassomonas sp. RHCl1]